jgi:chromosomal replication initiation ATPase DnaA
MNTQAIEFQTLRILRLERDVRLAENEIKAKENHIRRLESTVFELQKKLMEKPKREVKRKDFSTLPVKVRKLMKETLNPEHIKEAVCQHYGYKFKKLTEKGKKQAVVEPRWWICYFLYYHTTMGYNDIGREFNRDHSTIVNAVMNAYNSIMKNEESKRMHDTLLSKIKSKAIR